MGIMYLNYNKKQKILNNISLIYDYYYTIVLTLVMKYYANISLIYYMPLITIMLLKHHTILIIFIIFISYQNICCLYNS